MNIFEIKCRSVHLQNQAVWRHQRFLPSFSYCVRSHWDVMDHFPCAATKNAFKVRSVGSQICCVLAIISAKRQGSTVGIPLFEPQCTESSVLVVYRKYMENHIMREPMDKHLLFLKYSSPSPHTGGISFPP